MNKISKKSFVGFGSNFFYLILLEDLLFFFNFLDYRFFNNVVIWFVLEIINRCFGYFVFISVEEFIFVFNYFYVVVCIIIFIKYYDIFGFFVSKRNNFKVFSF